MDGFPRGAPLPRRDLQHRRAPRRAGQCGEAGRGWPFHGWRHSPGPHGRTRRGVRRSDTAVRWGRPPVPTLQETLCTYPTTNATTNDLSPLRRERPAAAGDLAGPLAQFRRRRCIENMRAMLCRAFDLGITHFDLANNYGPPPGRPKEFRPRPSCRSRAHARRTGHLHQSRLPDVARPLRRLGFAQIPAGQPRPKPAPDGSRLCRYLLLAPPRPGYAARRDHGRARQPSVSGKALYAGISNYGPEQTAARSPFRRIGTPCLIHQMKYSMFVRTAEEACSSACGGRHRRHRILSPGAGLTHRPLSGRRSRGLPRLEAGYFPETIGCHRGAPGAGAGPE